MKHTTKNGRKIELCDLETGHLENIIKLIKRKAKEGVLIRTGAGSSGEDFWYDEEISFGNEAKRSLNYSAYKSELLKRLK